jgi:hypothetical protein
MVDIRRDEYTSFGYAGIAVHPKAKYDIANLANLDIRVAAKFIVVEWMRDGIGRV